MATDLAVTAQACGPSRPGCPCRCDQPDETRDDCGHEWNGPWLTRTLPSGATEGTISCSRCGMSALEHDRWVMP